MIVGTAGHIDHGKSALVTALTGVAVDRLAEERRRGITIDLNFAPLTLEGLPPAGIVDVPGHEDFVRTMVAGASGIDLVLLVVDAAQGPEPQTWEHLAIVEQLGVPRGIPVVTKADLVAPDWLELVLAELELRLARSPVRFEAPAVVSAVTGQGIAELKARLAATLAAVPARRSDDLFRMPIDRAFSLPGVGTVVTGTPWSGSLVIGGSVRVLPAGHVARVRSLEAYGAAQGRSSPGSRTAVGLAGIERLEVRRGDVLVDADAPWQATGALDVELTLLAGAKAIDRRTRLRLHLGTAELLARVYPRGAIGPEATGLARLVLERPTVARGGDRFVLRSYSPVTTIGGGQVLDPAPPRRAAWPAELADRKAGARLLGLSMRRPGGVPLADLPVLLGETAAEARRAAEASPAVIAVNDRWIPRGRFEAARDVLMARLERHHLDHPAETGLSVETLRRALGDDDWMAAAALEVLSKGKQLRVVEGLAIKAGFAPRSAGGEAEVEQAVEALRVAGLTPPTVPELERQLGLRDLRGALRVAAGRGLVDAIEADRYGATSALEQFASVLRELGAGGAEISPPVVRERTGLSRKFLIPLLEWADRKAVTRRDADGKRTLR
jgi:selenocysteine-specific elongation factor